MRRYLHPFLLAFAFLFAQVGYTAHLATHLVAPASQDQGHGHEGPCELCVSFGQLGSGPLAFTLFQPPLLAAVQDWVLAARPLFKPVYAIYARARAPPAYLV
ncbi:MAG: hypothetical protein WCA45_13315 [Thiobacillaceae bacterium]